MTPGRTERTAGHTRREAAQERIAQKEPPPGTMQKPGKAPKSGRMPGEGKAVKPVPLYHADSWKEYELICFRDEVAEIFREIPYIGRIARQITTCTFSTSEADRCRCDGQAAVDKHRIAICEDIITGQNRRYWKMVYLHELAHVITGGGHTAAFHKLLDAMISIYNEETGENLQNDYQGIK